MQDKNQRKNGWMKKLTKHLEGKSAALLFAAGIVTVSALTGAVVYARNKDAEESRAAESAAAESAAESSSGPAAGTDDTEAIGSENRTASEESAAASSDTDTSAREPASSAQAPHGTGSQTEPGGEPRQGEEHGSERHPGTEGTAARGTAAAGHSRAAEKEPSAAGTEKAPEASEPAQPYWDYDEGLTRQLYSLFATDNTNNTDPESPYRAMTAEYKAELDKLAESWLAGQLTSHEVTGRMEAMRFVWPDTPGIERNIQRITADVYSVSGNDMEDARERIMLQNTSARHYLFLRVYYDRVTDSCRIWMLNGLVW